MASAATTPAASPSSADSSPGAASLPTHSYPSSRARARWPQGVSAGGGRSRIRTWEGVADGFTDPRRLRFDLRERQGRQLFGHALDMIMRLAQTLLAI